MIYERGVQPAGCGGNSEDIAPFLNLSFTGNKPYGQAAENGYEELFHNKEYILWKRGKWSGKPDLNRQPRAPKARALPS